VLVLLLTGYVWQTAENEWGNAVVATALSVVDDTALTGKVILGEIKVGPSPGLSVCVCGGGGGDALLAVLCDLCCDL